MSPVIPAGRIQLAEQAPDTYNAMFKFSRSVTLEHGLRHLIEIRASQLNGCAFCLDMHWKDARAAGESEERLLPPSRATGWPPRLPRSPQP